MQEYIQTSATMFVVTLILTSLLEEVIFRGITYTSLKLCGITSLFSACICSTVFALFHMQYGPIQMIFAFVVSMIFFGMNARTKNILSSMTAHTMYNLYIFIEFAR